MSNWLPITEYSIRNGLSVSTIRRKIKNKSLEHKIENGKYFIMDDNADNEEDDNKLSMSTPMGIDVSKKSFASINDVIDFAQRSIDTATELNRELIDEKEKVIHIQDGLILQLKEQVSELKMLVNILEKNGQQ